MNGGDCHLFIRYTCPFCIRVLRYLDDRGIKVTVRDISANSEDRDDLLNKGGKVQVPCLFYQQTILYESLDIIDWFETHWSDT